MPEMHPVLPLKSQIPGFELVSSGSGAQRVHAMAPAQSKAPASRLHLGWIGVKIIYLLLC